jgi:hypothetical protein
LRNSEDKGLRSRTLSVIKARGMGHSNQTHELVVSKNGIEIRGDATHGNPHEFS